MNRQARRQSPYARPAPQPAQSTPVRPSLEARESTADPLPARAVSPAQPAVLRLAVPLGAQGKGARAEPAARRRIGRRGGRQGRTGGLGGRGSPLCPARKCLAAGRRGAFAPDRSSKLLLTPTLANSPLRKPRIPRRPTRSLTKRGRPVAHRESCLPRRQCPALPPTRSRRRVSPATLVARPALRTLRTPSRPEQPTAPSTAFRAPRRMSSRDSSRKRLREETTT